ncbi:MAG: calcium-binding protein [Solirubrobacterales bacterium]
MGSRTGSDITAVRAWLAVLSLAGLAVFAALAPPGAQAASVSKEGAKLSFNAAGGEANQLNVSLAGGTYTVDDAGANVTPGAGCTAVDANTATCPAAGVTRVVAIAGDMNDFVRVGAATASTLFGSEGDDTLIGHNAGDVLVGCEGNDTMIGNGGADIHADALFCAGGGSNQFLGGAGNDTLHGGPGSDTFDAGAGEDDVRAEDGVVDLVGCGDDFDVGTADFDDVIDPDCEDLALSGFDPGEEDFFDEELGFEECIPEDVPPEEFEFFEEEGFEPCLEAGQSRCSSLRIRGRRASLRGGEVAIRVKLPRAAAGKCRARLKLDALLGSARAKAKPRRLKIGAEAFLLRPGQSKRFEVGVNRPGRRLLRRQGRMRVRVSVLSLGGGGASKLDSAEIKVSAGR